MPPDSSPKAKFAKRSPSTPSNLTADEERAFAFAQHVLKLLFEDAAVDGRNAQKD